MERLGNVKIVEVSFDIIKDLRIVLRSFCKNTKSKKPVRLYCIGFCLQIILCMTTFIFN